jgi:hypothetical protein
MIIFIVVHKIGTGIKYEVHNEAFNSLEDAMAFCKESATKLLQPDDEILEIKQMLCKSGYSIINNLKMKHKFIVHRITGAKK